MKPIALVGIMLCSYMTYGQFSKGDKYIDGVFHFSTNSMPVNGLQNVNRSYSLIPSFAFLFNDKLALGVQAGYENNYFKNNNGLSSISEHKINSIRTGIFARRYFGISDNFYFSLIGEIDFMKGSDLQTQTISNLVTERKTKNFQVFAGFKPNFIFFPSPKWGFDASFGYIGYRYIKNITWNDSSNLFSLSYGWISFGLSYYFRKARE